MKIPKLALFASCLLKPSWVLALTVERVDWVVDGQLDLARAAELIGVRVGEELDFSQLNVGLSRLTESESLKSASASFDSRSRVLELRVRLLEKIESRSITIEESGSTLDAEERARLAADLSEVLPAGVGDAVVPSLLEETRARILSRLEERGFPKAQVVTFLEQRGPLLQRLQVAVQTGAQRRLHKLQLKGFSREDRNEILRFLREQGPVNRLLLDLDGLLRLTDEKLDEHEVSVNIPYDSIEVANALNQWSQRARSAGYFDFQMLSEAAEGPDGVVVSLNLKRGLRYNVQFRGQVEYWERELRSRVIDRPLRLGVPFSLNDAEGIVIRSYKERGFEDVQVSTRVEDRSRIRTVTLTIREGVQRFLGRVSFDGVRDEEARVLEPAAKFWADSMGSPLSRVPFDESRIRTEIPKLLEGIRSRGYLDARVLDYRLLRQPNSRFVDVEVSVQVGDRHYLRDLEVVGAVGLSTNQLLGLVDLPTQGPVDPIQVERVASELLSAQQQLGFLSASVQVEYKKGELQSYGRDVDLEFLVTTAAQVSVGRRLNQGLSRTHEKVVFRELDRVALATAQPWSPDKVRDAEQRLLGLGVFSSAKIEAVGGSLSTRGDGGSWTQRKDLRTTVVERPGGSIEFGPGFRTDLGAIGFAEFTYRDLWGMNRSLVLRTQASRKIRDFQFVEQKHTVTFLEPYFAGWPLRLRIGVSYTKEDETVFLKGLPVDGFNSEEAALTVALERELRRDLRLVVGLYSLAKPRIFDIIKAPSDDRNTYRVATSGLTLIWDRRDNLFLPTQGFVVSTSFEHSDPWIGSDLDAHFSVLRWNGASYLRLPAGSVLATSVNLARLWGLGQTTGVPENRRLVLGGRSSIRSLSEKAIRFDQAGVKNEVSAEGKLEYRQPVVLDLGLAYFFDVGQLWAQGVGRSGWRRAIGFGVRYNTAVGPLALDFAFNLDRRSLENELKMQFSIGSF